MHFGPPEDSGPPDDAEHHGSSTDVTPGARVKPAAPYGTNQSHPGRVAPGYVATLVRTCDCRWGDDVEPPLEGQQFRVGQTLHVAAGLVEIAFACGAKAILEGPAVLELQSGKTSALKSGRMTADVPDEVEGFIVHTPVVQVVSLSAAEAQSVARLSATANCVWAEGSAATRDGAYLRPGQAVKLTSGLAEVTFGSGAKVILEGPANFEIESAKTAILHSGRLCADVPDDLEGFKIRTAVAEILSLPADSKSQRGKDASAAGPGKAPAASPAGVKTAAGSVALKRGEHVEIAVPAKKTAQNSATSAK
jgi:hypothetical protein